MTDVEIEFATDGRGDVGLQTRPTDTADRAAAAV
jgi:hypothetical protein